MTNFCLLVLRVIAEKWRDRVNMTEFFLRKVLACEFILLSLLSKSLEPQDRRTNAQT